MFKFKKIQKISEFKEKRFIFETAGTAEPSVKEAEPTPESEKAVSTTTEFKELIKNLDAEEIKLTNFQILKENKEQKNFADAFLYVKLLPYAEKLSKGNKKLTELMAGNLIESFNENIPEELETKLASGEIGSISLKNEGPNIICEIDGTSWKFPIESKRFAELEEERNEILNNQLIARQKEQTATAELLFE